jgi:hypothetical protein
MEVFILFGGDASGPARSASIMRENTTIVKEQRVHNTQELIDSETGYVTRQGNIRVKIRQYHMF